MSFMRLQISDVIVVWQWHRSSSATPRTVIKLLLKQRLPGYSARFHQNATAVTPHCSARAYAAMSGTPSPRTRLGFAQQAPLRRSSKRAARRVAAYTAGFGGLSHKRWLLCGYLQTLYLIVICSPNPAYPGAWTRQSSYARTLAALTTGMSVGEARRGAKPGRDMPALVWALGKKQ